MAISQEEALEIIRQKQKDQYSTSFRYLEGVAEIRRDWAAKTLGISRGTGINPELIYDNPSLQVQNLISPKDFEQLGFTNPQVKQFLEDPIHMGIVRNKSNVKLLQEVDNNFKAWTAVKNGFKLIGTNFANFVDMINENTEQRPPDRLSKELFGDRALTSDGIPIGILDSQVDWKGIAQDPDLQRQEVKADTIVGQYLLDIVEQAPQFAAQITAAAIGGIPATVGFMGTQIAGGTYVDLIGEGVASDRAFAASIANAALQSPLEALPFQRLFRPLNKVNVSSIGKTLFETSMTEALTEFLQQYPEAAVNLWARTEGMSREQRAKVFVANLGQTTQDALYSGAVAAPFGFLGGAGRVYLERSAARQVHQESMKVVEQDAQAIRQSELLKKSPEVIERFGNSQGEVIYVDAEATLKLYQSGKNNLLKDLNIAEEELVEAATKGEMLEIPKGTYEVAVAKDQTIHESLKEDIAFNNDGLTTNKINYLNDKDVKKSTQAVIEERKALTKEQNNIYREMRKTGIRSDVARSAITALKGHAQVMADYEGITASQWLKNNAPRFKKDLSNIVYTQNQPISPAAQKRIDEITEYLNTKIDIKIAGNGNGQYFYINNKGNLLLTKDKEKANRYSKNLEKKIASKYPNLNVVVEETKRARDISNDERYKLESEKEVLLNGFDSVYEYNAYLEEVIENSGQVVVNLNGEFVKRIKALDEKDYGINKNLSYRENAGNAELDSRDAYNAMSEFVEERLSLIDDILSENGYEVRRDDSKVSLSKYLTVTSKTHEDTYYKIRISDHDDHYGGNDLLLFTQDTMQESIEKLANFLARKESTDFYYQRQVKADTNTEAFKQWFGDSKIVDKEGNPLVVYHGTRNNEFDEFSYEKIGSTSDPGMWGRGFYFSDKETAQGYGSTIFAVYLSIKNPLNLKDFATKEALAEYLNVDESILTARRDAVGVYLPYSGTLTSAAIDKGHDGIFLDRGGKSNEYIAFNPNQIKSINNKGMFSTTDRNIYNQENRGAITWDSEGRAIIGFFQNADPSTVVHELAGHYFTENLRRIATRENAPEQAKKDWQTLLNDAKLKDWETASQEEKIAAQERWAELAENYFLQGKAPSIELKSVFAKFKRWIRQVYSSIKQANIQVPEEVSKVFDRLLASQQAIDELTVVEGYYNKLPVDLVESLSKAGQKDLERKLTKAREKAEDLTEKTLMNYIKADTQQAIKEERVKATQTFTQELSQQPLYQAIEILTNDFKKYYKTAKNTANAYQVKSETLFNGKGYKGRFREDMEVHFDYLAALNGFTSGSELAQKIIDSPTLQQAVQEKVDQHIQLTFPDYMQNPSQLRQEARENIYNDDSALLIATEQTVIQEQLTNALNLDERRQLARYIEIQAQIAAQEEIARLPIKQATNLQKYIAAERSAAVKADRALRAKDYTNAQLYKAQQLYNHNMVRESLSVRRRNEQITKYLKRQAKSKIKGWNKEVNFVQAADILQKINIPHSKYNPQLKLETLESYWNRNMLENPDITNIPDVALYGLHEGIRTNDLTISEYEDVANAIKNIRQLDKIGVDSNSFFTIDNGGSISERTEKLLDSASKLKDVLIDEAGAPRAQGKFLKGLQEYYLGNKKITQILLELDNLQDFGVWHDTFYRGVKEASDYKSTLIRDVSEKINEAFTTEGIDFKQRYRDTNNKVFIKEWNVNLSKQDLRTLILNMGSESNLKVLLGKTPVGFDQSEQWRQNNWTEEQIKQVAMQYLDEKDLRIVDKVWHAINSLYEPYNQMVTKMTGFSLAKVEARPIEFTLLDGKVFRSQGGYFPLKQDRRATKQAELNAEKALGDYVGVIPYTNTGASKARTGATYAIDLDFNNIFRHIDQVTQDTAFRPIMHDLNKIMRKDEIRDVLRHKLGEEGYTVIKDWQQAVSAGKETLTGNGGMDTIVNLIRSRTVTASLLLRPGVILQNNANFLLYGNSVQGFTEKDAISSYFKRGLGDYIPNAIGNTKRAKALREFVYNKSVMMRDKMDAPDFSLREYQSMVREGNILTRTSTGTAQEIGLKIELTREKINQVGTNLMAWSDQLTDIPMWLGAYEKALDLGKSEQDAAHFADTVIERSTGSGRLIDTSRLQRGGQWQRTMTMFTGFFNTQLNRWIREKQIFMDTGDIGRMFVFALKQYLGFGVVSALLSFKLPDEDDPWEWFIKDIVSWPLGMVPFFGPAVQSGLETMLGFQSYGYTMSPISSQIAGIYRAGKTFLNEEATTAEKAEALATSGAFLFGYPDQLNDWFFNLYDIVINEMEPDLMDLAKRRPRKER